MSVTTEKHPQQVVQNAEAMIVRQFRRYVDTKTSPIDRTDYLEPMNRSNWQKDFASWLIEQNKQASND